jgi:hypothetical protein
MLTRAGDRTELELMELIESGNPLAIPAAHMQIAKYGTCSQSFKMNSKIPKDAVIPEN